MGKSTTYSGDLLKLGLNGTAIANIADNAATSPLTVLYLAFHTADPGASGNQTTSEAAYPGYARKSVARTSSEFLVTGATAAVVNNQSFPVSTGSGSTLTHWSAGTASTGTGKILYSGTVTPNIAVGAAGVTPILTNASTIAEA